MKKSVKKLAALGLTTVSVVNLVACGSSDSNGSKSGSGEVTKPEKFSVMVNSTVVTETNGAKAFYDYLKELTGLDIEWKRPDHSGYYDAVANAFNSTETMPDVVLLSSDYYALYANNGFLWNMTDAWNNSDIKKSGRLVDGAENTIKNLMVNGEDGQKAMYGFTAARGDGCVSYLKQSWLEDAGIDVSAVAGVTLDFNTFYGYLKQMKEKKGHYVISAPGFICTSEPYTNYLPEFYQNAQYTFYKNASGEYVDGFTETAMKDALKRIRTAVEDGVIDKETVNNSTSNARDKFYSKDASSESGMFTYWSGTWANTLKVNLASKGLDDRLIALKPIKELGAYTQRIPGIWTITTAADNPEGIFKYFLESMLDGGDVQVAWEYGAKGTHWDTKAETVTLQGETSGNTYSEGEFHMLPSPEKPNTLQTKNNIDPLLAMATFEKTDSNPEGTDPGLTTVSQTAIDNSKFFFENCQGYDTLPMTTELSEGATDINTARNYVIAQTALGYMTIDEGMDYYNKTVGSLVKSVLKSLNKTSNN